METENIWSYRYRRKNERQSRTFATAVLIFLGSGITMSTILFVSSSGFTIYYDYQMIYFVGVIFGVIISTILLRKIRKLINYYISSIFMLITGGFYLGYINQNYKLIIAASFFSGTSFGITLLTCIIHCGEISIKNLRGSIISNIQLGIDVGIFIGILISNLISSIDPNDEKQNYIEPFLGIGILQTIYSILGLIFGFIFIYESPIFLLEANNEQEAIKNLIELRKIKNGINDEIENEIQEMKTIINNKSKLLISKDDLIPFIKILFYRLAYTLGTSVIINSQFSEYFQLYLNNNFVFLLFLGRFLANFIPIFLIEVVGRKLILLTSLFGSGLFLLIIQGIISSSSLIGQDYSFHLNGFQRAGLLAVFYNIFLGLGASSVTYTYMSEVFDYSRKIHINAIILIIEYILHILLLQIQYTKTSLEIFIFFTGVYQILAGILAFILMPETKGKTLLEAQKEMKNLFTLKIR